MKTRLLPTETPEQLAAAVAAAVAELGAGNPVALPTETVYGLAADATSPAALVKIFEAKERPLFDPLIVHLPDAGWLEKVATLPPEDAAWITRLADAFWPGPLTMVLPRTALVPDLATSGLPTVAVRRSAHPVFSAIVAAFGKPLAAPSANRFGRVSPTCAEHVMGELSGRIPLVIDGGPTRHGVESTIIAPRGGKLEILRKGPVTREMLEEWGEIVAPGAVAQPVAPGQLASHYAPGTPLRLLSKGATPGDARGGASGLLAWRSPEPETAACFGSVEVLSPAGDLREAASRLFAAMRRLDAAGLEEIVAEPVAEEGLGAAIMDRLRRASHR
ncbi:MAG TPA: L-threonylcarbamoyladenylate synthase [Chthoniobacteraceae bacterium]|nr:L-threonylcarbamoyladenylate synthase [Chthoniobacteraceae bacterium]